MITSETWYLQIVNLMDIDFPIIGALYCFSVIIIGQFFLLNLILAVIIQAFIKSQKRSIEEEIKRLEEGGDSLDTDGSGGGSDEDDDDESGSDSNGSGTSSQSNTSSS